MDKVMRIYLAVNIRSMGMTLAAAGVGEQMTYVRAFLGHKREPDDQGSKVRHG